MRQNVNNKTQAWKYYENGRSYNNRLVPNLYRTVNTNIEFFAGNQWLHIPMTAAMSRLSRPVFNIIKRIASLFVASLTSSATTITFEPLSYYDGENQKDPETNAAVYATAEVRNLFEKLKLDYRIRDALFDGAQTGDYCAHFYWNPDALPYGGAFDNARGEIEMELVDGINVMFGNPNITDVESQPYILIIGRDTVDNLRWEAERFNQVKNGIGKGGTGSDKIERDAIQPDMDTQWQAAIGGYTELTSEDDVNGKVLYVYMYSKVTKEQEVIDEETGLPEMEDVLDEKGNPVPLKDEDGKEVIGPDGKPMYERQKVKRLVTTVHVTKATKTTNIFEDVDTGLTRYPIAWGNWERQKNQYHGRALVTGIVPNQIFINSMMAMVFRHLQLQSFPKTIYNADLISQWNNEIGVALGVSGLQPGQDPRSVATTLQPADMSNQIVMAIDKVIEYTKECLGATDAQMGDMRLDNTSALMVLQASSEVPLENPRAILFEWVESIGEILLDMMGTYYGKRHVSRMREFDELAKDPSGAPIIDPMTGMMKTQRVKRRVMEEFDFSQLKKLWLNVSVEVGATTRYSEIAMVQTLDNLRRDGTLDLIAYLERIPDRLIPRKQELIDDLKAKLVEQEARQAAEAQQAAMTESGAMPQEPPRDAPGRARRPGGAPAMGGPVDAAKLIGNMPARMEAMYADLPKRAQATLANIQNVD